MEHVVFINFPATGHMNPTLPPGGFMQIQVTFWSFIHMVINTCTWGIYQDPQGVVNGRPLDYQRKFSVRNFRVTDIQEPLIHH